MSVQRDHDDGRDVCMGCGTCSDRVSMISSPDDEIPACPDCRRLLGIDSEGST
jgi:hypothetical protein